MGVVNFKSTILSIIIVIYLNSVSAKFPNDPKPCKYGDSECIINSINYFVSEKYGGESSINLVKIDPLKIAKVTIKQGAESPVNIDLVFTNNDLLGLKGAKVTKIKGFGSDLTQKHELNVHCNSLILVGPYEINGRVLILPIHGKGQSNMTVVNMDFKLSFSGKPMEKNGATYMVVDNVKLDGEPERLYYHFENLFNGDKALSDNMNLFLNENWREIFQEVRKSLYSAFAQIFQAVINNVFSKYPYDKYFEN